MVAPRPGRSIFESEEDSRRLWHLAVLRLDWNRVLLEAMGLHMVRRRDGEHAQRWFSTDAETAVCGECLRDALLAPDNPSSNEYASSVAPSLSTATDVAPWQAP